MGEMGKEFCPNFLQPFLENVYRRNCNDGNRQFIPVFHNPHRKCRPSPSAVARTLEYLVGIPCCKTVVSFPTGRWSPRKKTHHTSLSVIPCLFINKSFRIRPKCNALVIYQQEAPATNQQKTADKEITWVNKKTSTVHLGCHTHVA